MILELEPTLASPKQDALEPAVKHQVTYLLTAHALYALLIKYYRGFCTEL